MAGSSFAPITQANPGAGAAVSASNPFYATFWANQAALNFSTEKALAEDARGQRDTNAIYEYNRGLNNRAEPLKLTANQNTANSQGLAESGVLAKTQGQTQTNYAEKDARLSESRRNAIEKYQEGERNAITQYGLDTGKDVASAQAEGLKVAEEEGALPKAPVVPGGTPVSQIKAGTPMSEIKLSRNPTTRAQQEAAAEPKAPSAPTVVSQGPQPRSLGQRPETLRQKAAKKVVI
jgi:hypothetical protein